MRIGMSELVVILVVALFVLGPDKLPVYAKKMGEALAQFRKYSDEATKEIRESVVEPLQEAQRPLREAVEPLNELDKAVRSNVKDVQKSLADIGKVTPEKPEKEVQKECTEEAESVEEEPTTDAEEIRTRSRKEENYENWNNRTFDHFSCCSDRIRTYTDPETDPHVWKERKGIP